MRNEELTVQILQLLRQGYTQKEIALNLRKHRNTIYNHVKRIRSHILVPPEETVNKIDNKLSIDLNNMSHHDLIAYRRQLVPPPTEPVSKEQTRYIVEWKHDDNTINNQVHSTPKTNPVPHEPSKI